MELNYFFIKDGKNHHKVFFADILYVQTAKRYLVIVTADRKFLFKSTMNNFEHSLPALHFCRVHKSYIISLFHTSTFNNETALVKGHKIPIGREYKEILPGRVPKLRADIGNFINLSQADMDDLINNTDPR